VYTCNKALEEKPFAANVYAFCLRISKDSSVGEIDESIISVFLYNI